MTKYGVVSTLSDVPYLIWQAELQIFNFRKTTNRRFMEQFYVVVCSIVGPSVLATNLMHLHPFPENILFVSTSAYKKETSEYPALYKPLGLQCFLDYRQQLGLPHINLLLIDPDVLFVNDPLTLLQNVSDHVTKKGTWCFSDCSSYLDILAHRKAGYTDDELHTICRMFGSTLDMFEQAKWKTGGAQYFFGTDITSELCREVMEKGATLHKYIQSLPQKRDAWFAEMLAWHMVSVKWKGLEHVNIHRDLDFMLVDSSLSKQMCLLHLSGNCKKVGAFDKTLFTQAPWHRDNLQLLSDQCTSINIDWAASVYLYWLLDYMDARKVLSKLK